MGHQHQNKSVEAQGGQTSLWHKIIHERLIYLFFFTIGASITLIISIFFSGQSLITIKTIEIALLSVAVLIKSFEALKKLTCKQLIKTQSQFPIPYLFTILNIFLLVEVCGYLNQYDINNSTVNTQYATIESFRFFFMTYMCSLVTNKKTTSKLEYWYYTAIIVIVVCCDVYIIVLKIRSYSVLLDSMSDQMEDNLIGYLNKEISDQTYMYVKNFIGNQQSAIENASALDIACVASVVANYLVMMDMIARPLEKMEQAEHIKHQVHSSLHGGSEKHDINYKLIGNQITAVNHSGAQSDRSTPEREYRPSQLNNKAKQPNRNTDFELGQKKSQL